MQTVRKFLRKVANRQTDSQTDKQRHYCTSSLADCEIIAQMPPEMNCNIYAAEQFVFVARLRAMNSNQTCCES